MNKMLCLAGFLLALSSCGDRAKNYDATGTFEATEVTVTAEALGELQDFNVEEGQWLESGTKVGRIDDRQLVLKREQLETNNDQLTATYRQLEANKQATSDKNWICRNKWLRFGSKSPICNANANVSRNCCATVPRHASKWTTLTTKYRWPKNNLPPPKNKSRRKTTPCPNKTKPSPRNKRR